MLRRSTLVLVAIVALGCEGTAAHGGMCTRDETCGVPEICVLGHCRHACRESRDCEVGAHCLVEPATGVGACSLPSVDTCTTSECPAGFVCQGGECLNACGAITRCPDGVCVADACLPIVGDAGVIADAGIDAGASCHGPMCDPIVAIEIDGPRTFALTTAGFGWAWGGSGTSTLGDGLVAHGACANCSPTPVRILGSDGTPLGGLVEIAASADHACARRTDGTVWCWGYGGEGQLGQNGGSSPVPVQVVDASGAPIDAVTAIAGGREHTCVIRGAAREVWCWGQDFFGQLGDGTMVDSGVAVHASAFTVPAAALVIAQTHTLIVSDDGHSFGLGEDQCAVTGTTLTTGANVLTATMGPVGSIASLGTSTWNTCTLGSDGVVSCWGLRDAALGSLATTFPDCMNCGSGVNQCAATPQIVTLPPGVVFDRILGGGDGVYFGFTALGELFVWGGTFGAPISQMPVPERITIAGSPRLIDAAVFAHLCVLTEQGDVYCEGANDQGQLGRGVVTASDGRLLPVVWP